MASLKFGFIVAVAAFVSYALIGSVACDEALESILKDSRLSYHDNVAAVEAFLRDHPDKSYEIEGHTVGQLEDICKETFSNCASSADKNTMELWKFYDSKGYRGLCDYIYECRHFKVSIYCWRHINEVGRYILNETVSKEDQELVRSFMENLEDIGVFRRMYVLRVSSEFDSEKRAWKERKVFANIVQAYLKIRQKNCGKQFVNRNEDAEFRAKLSKALRSFEQICETLELYRVLSSQFEIDQEGDILIRKYSDLHDIADRFDSVLPIEESELNIRDETISQELELIP